jgi:hypothetical protein
MSSEEHTIPLVSLCLLCQEVSLIFAEGGEFFCSACRSGNFVPGQRRPEPGGNTAKTIGETIYNTVPGYSSAWQQCTRIPSTSVTRLCEYLSPNICLWPACLNEQTWWKVRQKSVPRAGDMSVCDQLCFCMFYFVRICVCVYACLFLDMWVRDVNIRPFLKG